jgi:hypothetical protein
VDNAGNIYICGTTKSWSAGSDDKLVAKFDSAITRIWNKTWGGALQDIGWDLALASFEITSLKDSIVQLKKKLI